MILQLARATPILYFAHQPTVEKGRRNLLWYYGMRIIHAGMRMGMRHVQQPTANRRSTVGELAFHQWVPP